MKIERIWAMPCKRTFTIPPIRALLDKYEVGMGWIDPFAGESAPFGESATVEISNDLNPEIPTDNHMDALVFLRKLHTAKYRGVLFDPPYSITQAAQCYKSFGKDKLEYSPSNMGYWAAIKNEMARILVPEGIAICCGWSSMGLGKGRGFVMEEILLIPHGGSKNDTIVTVERKARDGE